VVSSSYMTQTTSNATDLMAILYPNAKITTSKEA
jgi:hypothetical protein